MASRRSGRCRRWSQVRSSTGRRLRIADLRSRAIGGRQATHAAVFRRSTARKRAHALLIGGARPIVLRGICAGLRLVEPKRDPAAEREENRGGGHDEGHRDRLAVGHRGGSDSLNFARADSALCRSGLCGKRASRTSSSSTASRRSPPLPALRAELKRSFSVASVEGDTLGADAPVADDACANAGCAGGRFIETGETVRSGQPSGQ